MMLVPCQVAGMNLSVAAIKMGWIWPQDTTHTRIRVQETS